MAYTIDRFRGGQTISRYISLLTTCVIHFPVDQSRYIKFHRKATRPHAYTAKIMVNVRQWRDDGVGYENLIAYD